MAEDHTLHFFFLGGPDSEAASRLTLYPAYDISPFESISPHNGLISRRMGSLARLLDKRSDVVVVATAEALMEKAYQLGQRLALGT